MDLKNFFEPKSIAVIGASRNPRKPGNIILKNLVEMQYSGNIFAVNKKAVEVLGKKSYLSIKDIQGQVDLAIIATPASTVYGLLEECAFRKINDILVISGGFSESGNEKEEERIRDLIKKKKLNVLGPNCLGVFDSYSNLDTIFNPREKMERPKKGGISMVCQSGAVGSVILDLMAKENYGLRRFISYGNASGLDESDFIDYLGKDEKTKVICLYLEGVQDGEKFLETCKKVSKKKPIIAIKSGVSTEGAKAVKHHTGAIAGKSEIYKGVFRQGGILQVNSIEELLDCARIFERSKPVKGNKILVITNGGELGIIAADQIALHGLELADLSSATKEKLKGKLSPNANLRNPLDLIGDASDESYKAAIESGLEDSNVDMLLVILLPQTPTITINLLKILKNIYEKASKPICLVIPGGSFADTLKREAEDYIPSFSFSTNAVLSLKELVEYHKIIKGQE